jgi:hypothetical protein
MGEGWWAFDSLPTAVSDWWLKDLLELNSGFLHDLFHWAKRITGCIESTKVRGVLRRRE